MLVSTLAGRPRWALIIRENWLSRSEFVLKNSKVAKMTGTWYGDMLEASSSIPLINKITCRWKSSNYSTLFNPL